MRGFRTALDSVMRRIKLAAAPARVLRSEMRGGVAMCQVTLLSGEVRDDVPLLLPTGMAARPTKGVRALAAFLGGDRSSGVLLATSDPEQPNDLEEGEIELGPPGGARLRLCADGTVRILGRVVLDGSLEASGELQDADGTLDALREAYRIHTHPETGSNTGPATPQV